MRAPIRGLVYASLLATLARKQVISLRRRMDATAIYKAMRCKLLEAIQRASEG